MLRCKWKRIEAENVESNNERVVRDDVKLQIVVDSNHYRLVHPKFYRSHWVDNCLSCSVPLQALKLRTASSLTESHSCSARERQSRNSLTGETR